MQLVRRLGAQIVDDYASPEPFSAPRGRGDLGRAVPSKARGSDEGLAEHLCRADVCELFSPPRVCLEAAKFGIAVGIRWISPRDGILARKRTAGERRNTWTTKIH